MRRVVLQPQHDILPQRDHEVLDGVETVLGLLCRERLVALRPLLIRMLPLGALGVGLLGAPG